MRNLVIVITLTAAFLYNCQPQSKSIDSRVDSLLSLMTLEEKIGQMNQYSGFWDATGPLPTNQDTRKKYEQLISGQVGSVLNVEGVKNVRALQEAVIENSRLKIPLIFARDVIHGFKTITPIPLGEAASWDPEAVELSSHIAAVEASSAGLNWTFAPMVDISRDARWGRGMEGSGEDPFLGSVMAKARIRGFQGEDLSANNTIAACAKHFAGYGFVEGGKEYNRVNVGTSSLYNIIFPPFQAAIEADVKTFMNAFNTLNDIPATGHVLLQRDILKGVWGFKGFVVSDWGSVAEMVNHGYASDDIKAAEYGVEAGCDMDMQSLAYINHLEEVVNDGRVDMALIDDAVRRILRVKFELGLFDDPFKYCNEQRESEVTGSDQHREIALDMAKKSMVLLKNEGNLLPLKKNGLKVALIGELADAKDSPLGNWRPSADSGSAVSVFEGLQAYQGNKIEYSKGPALIIGKRAFREPLVVNNSDRTGFTEAIESAKKADVVVMVLGEDGYQSGEGRSRTQIDLPGLQQELLKTIYSVNKNIILVLMNGRPLAIPWAAENIPAILEVWQPGIEGGNAIANILYGDYNPGGKLPVSFPRSVGQMPLYYNHMNTGRPGPKEIVFWSSYNDEENSPLFPFGYGLSYTTFAYNNLKVDVIENRQVNASVRLKNTGKMAGEEVVQLYIRDRAASISRPVKELKGFEKVYLEPGEFKTVNFILTEKELGFYNTEGEFLFEPGEFDIMIGTSSVEGLTDEFVIN
jgi:beta-glucosidase